jgi:hypothetical protein
MKTRIIILVAVLLALAFFGNAAYTWYFTDNFPGGTPNSTNWQLNNSAYQNGKMAISKLAIPDSTADAEVRSTLPATCPGARAYVHLLRATRNYDDNWLRDAYRVQVRFDVPNCVTSLTISKVTSAGGWVQLLHLTNQPFPAGAVWRSFVRNDGPSPGVTVMIGTQQWTVNDTSLTTGKPGVGHSLFPGATPFAELPVSLGGIDRTAPAAATGLSAIPSSSNIQLSWTAAVDIYNYSYDTMGRPAGTTYQTSGAGSPQTLVDSVSYNTAGQLTQMRWFNLSGGGSQTETRQYNALGQLTRLTVPGQIDREYRFSASANDGKATSQKDYISGEEVEYQYDSLGRLSSAETTGAGGWGISFVYDGFGNRLQQNAIKGTVPTQSILVDPRPTGFSRIPTTPTATRRTTRRKAR